MPCLPLSESATICLQTVPRFVLPFSAPACLRAYLSVAVSLNPDFEKGIQHDKPEKLNFTSSGKYRKKVRPASCLGRISGKKTTRWLHRLAILPRNAEMHPGSAPFTVAATTKDNLCIHKGSYGYKRENVGIACRGHEKNRYFRARIVEKAGCEITKSRLVAPSLISKRLPRNFNRRTRCGAIFVLRDVLPNTPYLGKVRKCKSVQSGAYHKKHIVTRTRTPIALIRRKRSGHMRSLESWEHTCRCETEYSTPDRTVFRSPCCVERGKTNSRGVSAARPAINHDHTTKKENTFRSPLLKTRHQKRASP